MEKKYITSVLSSIYDEPLDEDSAWRSYSNFVELFMQECEETTDYLCSVLQFNKHERLKFRTKLAEKGYELTPVQLNQHIILIMLALSTYCSLPNS